MTHAERHPGEDELAALQRRLLLTPDEELLTKPLFDQRSSIAAVWAQQNNRPFQKNQALEGTESDGCCEDRQAAGGGYVFWP